MYKIIAIVLSTLLIAAFQIQAASAGCGGGHGGFRTYQSHAPSRHAAQQSRARKQAVAAAKQKKAAQVARAEKAAEKKADEPKTASATFTEKKTEAASTEVSDENVTVAAVQGCSKFIPATGTTVTVECAKQ
jgi:hypothetical protein